MGGSAALISKGISFGTLTRTGTNSWNTAGVTGLQASSLAGNPPNLLIRPFHQAGAVVSLRQFTNSWFRLKAQTSDRLIHSLYEICQSFRLEMATDEHRKTLMWLCSSVLFSGDCSSVCSVAIHLVSFRAHPERRRPARFRMHSDVIDRFLNAASM